MYGFVIMGKAAPLTLDQTMLALQAVARGYVRDTSCRALLSLAPNEECLSLRPYRRRRLPFRPAKSRPYARSPRPSNRAKIVATKYGGALTGPTTQETQSLASTTAFLHAVETGKTENFHVTTSRLATHRRGRRFKSQNPTKF